MRRGRLGWNALDWATAPGLHFPCAGGKYPDQNAETPDPGSAPNCSGTGQEGNVNPTKTAAELVSALQGLGPPALPPPADGVANTVENTAGATTATGLLPEVIAAGAGGTFGADGQQDGSASDGYWHGYTLIRLIPGGAESPADR